MKTKRASLLIPILSLLLITACSVYSVRDKQLNWKFSRAGMEEKYVDLENARVHYWIGGSGPNLVMIQGFGADAKFQWFDQVGDFAKEYTLIVPDIVYFGGTTANKEDFSLDFQAETVVQLMNHLAVNQAHVMGISYGGLVAYKMANDYADRVESLIIVDSPGAAFTMEDYERMLKYFQAENIAEIIVPEKPEDIQRLLEIAYYKPPPVPKFAYKSMYEALFTSQVEEKIKMLNWMIEQKDELLTMRYKISQPTLIIWGEFDPLFPVEVGERLQQSIGSHAEMKVIAKTRHAPNMEKPKEFNRLVLEFL